MAVILISGKDAQHLEMIAQDLRQRTDHRVEIAANAYDALAHLLLGSFQLIAIELDLPYLDGLEIIRAAANRNSRALIAAARCNKTRDEEAKRAGAMVRTEEPLNSEFLLQLLGN